MTSIRASFSLTFAYGGHQNLTLKFLVLIYAAVVWSLAVVAWVWRAHNYSEILWYILIIVLAWFMETNPEICYKVQDGNQRIMSAFITEVWFVEYQHWILIKIWLIDWFVMSMELDLRLRTASNNGPVVHHPGDMWGWSAMVVMGKLLTRPPDLSGNSTSRDIWERVGEMDDGLRILQISIWHTSKDL
jgi:hypothetical protein